MNRFDLAEQANHPRTQEDDFSKLVAHGLQRRRFLGVSATALGVTGFLGGLPFAASAASKHSPAGMAHNASNAVVSPRMGFAPVAANAADTITLPAGYKWGCGELVGRPRAQRWSSV